MDKKDLRYLLECKELPIYDVSKLLSIWEDILKEYERLTENQSYTMSLRKISADNQKVNRIVGLTACYWMLKYKWPGGEEDLKFWDISNCSLVNLKTIILREETKLNIQILRDKSHKKLENNNFDFDKFLVSIENNLERNLDIESISVKKWVYLCKSIEEKSRQLEALTNGRRRQNIT